MKKILLLTLLFSQYAFAEESWNKSVSKDESGKEYQIYTLLSMNNDKTDESKMALILVSPKENIFSKLGFAKTQGAVECPNYCQYYVQFDNTASKYTFSIENQSIKLENSQKEDFLKNVQSSKEMTLVLNQKRFYFNLQNPNWKFIPEPLKK